VQPPDPDAVINDSVVLPKFVLSAAAARGADARILAREAHLPGWVFTVGQGAISCLHAIRLWELAEWTLQDPDIAIDIAGRHQRGDLSLYDYLFLTAPTLRDGLAANGEFLHLVTNNSRWDVLTETDNDVTYSYAHSIRAHRGIELGAQFGLGLFCAKVRKATGEPVVPVRVGFAQRAPRSHRAIAEAFDTGQIEFDQPVNTLTFRQADLDLPLRGADPVLAGILRRYAATLPPGEPVTWYEQFRVLLYDSLAAAPTLDAMALRLAMSRRSLQRLLAEHGTTWRAELDHARRRRAEEARSGARPTLANLARQLGYSDPRAVSRALRRLNKTQPDDPVGPAPRVSHSKLARSALVSARRTLAR
jgi:AraC-like DNA-binding protein